MPQQQRLTDAQRLSICELADEGLSVREVAARLSVAPSTVTRTARRMGLAFDRSATERATAARIADAKARRAETAARLLDLVNSELDRLHRPYRTHAFVGGQDAGYLEHVLPQPDAPARLAIVRAAGHLVDKHLSSPGSTATTQASPRPRALSTASGKVFSAPTRRKTPRGSRSDRPARLPGGYRPGKRKTARRRRRRASLDT